MIRNRETSVKLDWQRLLGFDQVESYLTNEPGRAAANPDGRLARVGARVGGKELDGLTSPLAARIGGKIGGKLT